MHTITFCENNFVHGTEAIVDRLESEFKDSMIVVEPCQALCSECAKGPYAVLDGEFISAPTADELYEKISLIML